MWFYARVVKTCLNLLYWVHFRVMESFTISLKIDYTLSAEGKM